MFGLQSEISTRAHVASGRGCEACAATTCHLHTQIRTSKQLWHHHQQQQQQQRQCQRQHTEHFELQQASSPQTTWPQLAQLKRMQAQSSISIRPPEELALPQPLALHQERRRQDEQQEVIAYPSSSGSSRIDAGRYLEPAGDVFDDSDDMHETIYSGETSTNQPQIRQVGHGPQCMRALHAHCVTLPSALNATEGCARPAGVSAILGNFGGGAQIHPANSFSKRSGIGFKGVSEDRLLHAVCGTPAVDRRRKVMEHSPPQERRTTVMIQHIDRLHTEESVCRILNSLGFAGTYDVIYVPRNRKKVINLGYAFVNFLLPSSASECISRCSGMIFGQWVFAEEKPCFVEYSSKQGSSFLKHRLQSLVLM